MQLNEAIDECRASQLTGWELVRLVTDTVHKNMKYSLTNPYMLHATAFRNGRGYCVQQAFCVADILRSLGVDVQPVYARSVKVTDSGLVSGHTWNRVRIDGEERDVCSCHAGNSPGSVNFVPLTQVKRYTGAVVAAGYLGSLFVCIQRHLKNK